jgi:hypothetical protein
MTAKLNRVICSNSQETEKVEYATKSDELITRYLLGDVSEKERDEIEDLYSDDDDFFERISIIEDELLDSYVAGEMTGRERELFESFFLISETRRQRLQNARVLHEALLAASPSAKQDVAATEPRSWKQFFSGLWHTENRALRWAAAIAMLVVAFGLFRFVFVDKAQSPGDGPSETVSFELGPTAVRSGDETQKLTILRTAENVELKLYLRSDAYKSYRAELQSTAGGPVWAEGGLPTQQAASGKFINIVLPENLLPAGGYRLTLFGETEERRDIAAEYQFKVERE